MDKFEGFGTSKRRMSTMKQSSGVVNKARRGIAPEDKSYSSTNIKPVTPADTLADLKDLVDLECVQGNYAYYEMLKLGIINVAYLDADNENHRYAYARYLNKHRKDDGDIDLRIDIVDKMDFDSLSEHAEHPYMYKRCIEELVKLSSKELESHRSDLCCFVRYIDSDRRLELFEPVMHMINHRGVRSDIYRHMQTEYDNKLRKLVAKHSRAKAAAKKKARASGTMQAAAIQEKPKPKWEDTSYLYGYINNSNRPTFYARQVNINDIAKCLDSWESSDIECKVNMLYFRAHLKEHHGKTEVDFLDIINEYGKHIGEARLVQKEFFEVIRGDFDMPEFAKYILGDTQVMDYMYPPLLVSMANYISKALYSFNRSLSNITTLMDRYNIPYLVKKITPFMLKYDFSNYYGTAKTLHLVGTYKVYKKISDALKTHGVDPAKVTDEDIRSVCKRLRHKIGMIEIVCAHIKESSDLFQAIDIISNNSKEQADIMMLLGFELRIIEYPGVTESRIGHILD